MELEGYTDSTGSLDYNLALSQRRVEAVRRFLVQQGVDLRRIHAAGLGPIADSTLPADQKRRVTVKLDHPRRVARVASGARSRSSGRPTAPSLPPLPRCAICHGQSDART